MRLHRNAKTTPLMRRLIIDRVTRHAWPQTRAAEAARVRVRTVAKTSERCTNAATMARGGATRGRLGGDHVRRTNR